MLIIGVCRAARFCNGAAHGGQVVGPSAIVPGLLQAWGCENIPDALGRTNSMQVTAYLRQAMSAVHAVSRMAVASMRA